MKRDVDNSLSDEGLAILPIILEIVTHYALPLGQPTSNRQPRGVRWIHVVSEDECQWIAHRDRSCDGTLKRSSSYLEYARNLYRVLLTRGMKGCYVYFVDKDTERFVRSRMRT
jgi:hypothetical protein